MTDAEEEALLWRILPLRDAGLTVEKIAKALGERRQVVAALMREIARDEGDYPRLKENVEAVRRILAESHARHETIAQAHARIEEAGFIRGRDGLHRLARQMRLRFVRPKVRNALAYSEADLADLRAWWGVMPKVEIAARLQRSLSSVKVRAHKLQLAPRPAP